MQMKVKHGLPRAASVVENGAVAVGQLALRCELRGNQLHASKHRRVLCRGFGQRDQVLPRADQEVGRRLRLDVFKREYFLVLIDQFRRDFFLADLAEQAIVHDGSLECRVDSGKFFNSLYWPPRSFGWSSRNTNV